MKLVLLGAGRIGQVHAANIARHPLAELAVVVDVNQQAAAALASKYKARVVENAQAALAEKDIAGVLVCSSTDTHVEMIELAAKYGKPVFCEKPIDLDLAKVDSCLAKVKQAGVALVIGFNRRFDPHFKALKEGLDGNNIGHLEVLKITSRDPEPPPPAYAKVSGGIFRDMTIHDLDMARYLLDEEPVEIFATGSCLVDPEIGQAGDLDTVMLILKTASGKLCQIDNSRRAVYGYDQRIEAFGEKGMLMAGNPTPTTLQCFGQAAVSCDKPHFFFLERYQAAYRAELDHFIDVVAEKTEPLVSGIDGRLALWLADAATRSHQAGRPISLEAANESS
jgi:myo-inositol 2-dehydrogenase / D-chiro-inositol 1-dehydrogenase